MKEQDAKDLFHYAIKKIGENFLTKISEFEYNSNNFISKEYFLQVKMIQNAKDENSFFCKCLFF